MQTEVTDRNAELLEDEVLAPLRGEELSDIDFYVACKLLREASQKPLIPDSIVAAGRAEWVLVVHVERRDAWFHRTLSEATARRAAHASQDGSTALPRAERAVEIDPRITRISANAGGQYERTTTKG